MSATYDGFEFKTELEARWAAFFDLAGWRWWTNPIEVGNWKPDFRLTFECSHSECGGSHTILVSVLPVFCVEEVKSHPALTHVYSVKDTKGNLIADAGAVFGSNPSATYWEMSHGAGGGAEEVASWVSDANALWDEAVTKVSNAA